MPSNNQFKPLPLDLDGVISSFKEHIKQSERYVKDFEKRHFNGIREKAIIYCLQHAVDLAKGCLAAVENELPDSTTTLSRAILETLFWTRYVSISKENAQEFTDAPFHEMKRTARKNLKAGYARVSQIDTKEDKTEEILNSDFMKIIPKRILIEDAAKVGGLERVYTNIYGFISMTAHGRAINLRTNKEIKTGLYTSLSVALGAFQCTELIADDWISHRKQTEKNMLVRCWFVY